MAGDTYGVDKFQSTRPRGARLSAGHGADDQRAISIHAPTRGATAVRQQGFIEPHISIHAPTRGATFLQVHTRSTYPDFNPRAHAGRDAACGTTGACAADFNPRAHAGRDPCSPRPAPPYEHFNPRAHAGRDISTICSNISHFGFQSTRPRGARRFPLLKEFFFMISIHAPTRGATDGDIRIAVVLDISIHAPTRGATMFLRVRFQ